MDWTFRPDGEGQVRRSLLRWSRRDGDQRAPLFQKDARQPGQRENAGLQRSQHIHQFLESAGPGEKSPGVPAKFNKPFFLV